ncbi:MAG: YbbR-like domain-containing protein [Gemmatimonadota bacterium]
MPGWREAIVRNWALKLTALALSVALWFAVRAETTVRAPIENIAVEVDLGVEGWVLDGPPSPDSVTVEFEGPVRELISLRIDPPRFVVPVESVEDTTFVRALDFRLLEYARGARPDLTQPVDVRPGTITLFLDRIVTRLIPVAVPLAGALPDGLRLLREPTVDPAVVQVSGPARVVNAMVSVSTLPIDLGELSEDAVVEAALDDAVPESVAVAPGVVRVQLAIGADRATDELERASRP